MKDWPRTEVGTLQCPCGKPGEIFVCLDVELIDLELRGLFGGFCSNDCWRGWNTQQPAGSEPETPNIVGVQHSMFG